MFISFRISGSCVFLFCNNVRTDIYTLLAMLGPEMHGRKNISNVIDLKKPLANHRPFDYQTFFVPTRLCWVGGALGEGGRVGEEEDEVEAGGGGMGRSVEGETHTKHLPD